jgi:hypothetical protein
MAGNYTKKIMTAPNFVIIGIITCMEIKTHKEMEQLRKLPFFYFCGRNFNDANDITRDHVPPKAVFLSSDRKNPLILPSHYSCNQKESWADEVIGQLIQSLHGIYPPKKQMRVKIGVYKDSGNMEPVTTLENLNLRGLFAVTMALSLLQMR